MVNNSIAIIPARGGAKRIPEKNIVDFNGIPMIAKTIQAAKKTNLFRHVLVSTDDEKIAAVAKKYGAEVPFLRENYCDDFATVSQATIYAIKQAEEFYQEKYAQRYHRWQENDRARQYAFRCVRTWKIR